MSTAMMGYKTLREIREQLAAERAGATLPPPDPSGVLESLDRLAAELGRPAGRDEREPPADGSKAATDATTERGPKRPRHMS